jgi:hypothetical protein
MIALRLSVREGNGKMGHEMDEECPGAMGGIGGPAARPPMS